MKAIRGKVTQLRNHRSKLFNEFNNKVRKKIKNKNSTEVLKWVV